MIAVSKQAPFGKGSDTIVDTTVRDTFEIDASRVQLRHPKWAEQERKIVNDVAKQLGFSLGVDKVSAELYKLLVYSPGAKFKAHTEYAPLSSLFH